MNSSNRVALRTNSNIRDYYQIRWLNVFIVVLGLGGLLWLGSSEFNPDLQSYRVIYESGGAWLSDQGRDPLFILLITLSSNLFGPSSYESFRLILSFYFLLFGAFLAWGKIIPMAVNRWVVLQLPLAIVSFGMTRFTVQIREGLASTLILFGFACIMRSDSTVNFMKRQILIWVGLVLVGCAALVHLGTIFIFIGLVLVFFSQRMGIIKANRMKLLWVVISFIGVMLLGWVAMGGPLAQYISPDYGISEQVYYADESKLSLSKLIFWGGYGVVCALIAKAVSELVSKGQLRGRLAGMLVVISGPITFVTIISIYVLIIIGAPSLFTDQYVRLLNLLLGINLLFVASLSNRSMVVILSSLFLMSYQIRSIVDSVSFYFGVNILSN